MRFDRELCQPHVEGSLFSSFVDKRTGIVFISSNSGCKRVDTTNAMIFEKDMDKVLEGSGAKDYCIDFSQMDFVSTAGLRVACAFLKSVRRKEREAGLKEGSVRVAINPSERVRDVLELTGLDQVFDVFPRE